MTAARQNILLITADQFRFDAIGAHGNPAIDTPNLDRLVESGTSFHRAYTESPVCVPARACILTGQLPHESGVFHNGTPLAEGTSTMVRELQTAGHRTHAIGKMHFNPIRADHGFDALQLSEEAPLSVEIDEYLTDLRAGGVEHVLEPHGVRHELYYSPQPSQLPADLHTTAWTGRKTAEFVRQMAEAEAQQPFFCWTSFIKPHPPFDPPYPYYLQYDPMDMPDPIGADDAPLGYHAVSQHRVKWTSPDMNLDQIRTMRAYYYACVSHVDAEIGRILDALDSTGLRESTLIMFTADHGEYLGDHRSFGKRGFHDPAARIPLIVNQPGVVPAGHISQGLVGLTDIRPTVLAAVGLEPAGRSLLDVARGRRNTLRDVFFGQYHQGPLAEYCVIDATHKLTYSAADRRESLFGLGSDETVDLLVADPSSNGDPARKATSLRAALAERFAVDGYPDALRDGEWIGYPQPKPPPLPGSGDRETAGRGRQYPVFVSNPGIDRISKESESAYA